MAPVHMERGIRGSSEDWGATYFSAPRLFHRERQGNFEARLDDRSLDARAGRVHRDLARARHRPAGGRANGAEVTPDAVVLGRPAGAVATSGGHRVRTLPRPPRLPPAAPGLAQRRLAGRG